MLSRKDGTAMIQRPCQVSCLYAGLLHLCSQASIPDKTLSDKALNHFMHHVKIGDTLPSPVQQKATLWRTLTTPEAECSTWNTNPWCELFIERDERNLIFPYFEGGSLKFPCMAWQFLKAFVTKTVSSYSLQALFLDCQQLELVKGSQKCKNGSCWRN